MGKFKCTCGYIISDTQVANEVTGWLLSNKSGEDLFNWISSVINEYFQYHENRTTSEWKRKYFNETYPSDEPAGEMLHDVITNKFFNLTLAAMECECCGRIWLQRNPDENFYLGYVPENDPSERKKVLGYNTSTNC